MKAKGEICSMKILLTAATSNEIAPFKSNNNAIDSIITGVGIPATIYHIQKAVSAKQYNLILQAGIAGAFDDKLILTETVIVQQDCFGDIGIEEKEKFMPIFNSPFFDKNEFPYKDGWLVNTAAFLHRLPFKKVKAVTVNKVSDSVLQKQQLTDQFDAAVESMEGAALHYVALQLGIPFLQVRAISNYVGVRDKQQWQIKDAIVELNKSLAQIIDLLKTQLHDT